MLYPSNDSNGSLVIVLSEWKLRTVVTFAGIGHYDHNTSHSRSRTQTVFTSSVATAHIDDTTALLETTR